jgi:hypothetical protein
MVAKQFIFNLELQPEPKERKHHARIRNPEEKQEGIKYSNKSRERKTYCHSKNTGRRLERLLGTW